MKTMFVYDQKNGLKALVERFTAVPDVIEIMRARQLAKGFVVEVQ